MKAPHLVALDRDDRRALAELAGSLVAFAVMAAGVMAGMLVLTLALALCWRLFVAVAVAGAG